MPDTETKLKEFLGSDAFELWAEMTWPNDTREEKTEEEIHETLVMTYYYRSNLWIELECSCNGVTGPCKVCQAFGRIVARNNQEGE